MRARFLRTAILVALGVLLVAGCAPEPAMPEAPTEAPLRVAASSSARPLISALGEAWLAMGQGIPLDLWETNSALALSRLGAGEADLAATCWKPQEGIPLPPGVADGWHWTPFAYDGIVFIVHPSNPVERLALAQVRDIFAGRVQTWLELGGDAERVVQVSREEGSGTRWDFEALVMQGRRVTPAALVMPGGRAVLEFVGENPGAIGYVALAEVSPQVKALTLEGVSPSLEMVRDGRYPLPRLCYLVLPGRPSPLAEQFVRFATSQEGQEAVARALHR
ncbi:MAG: phosphate ABC transporter substrate-binding protein [Anaerolineae bacterium]